MLNTVKFSCSAYSNEIVVDWKLVVLKKLNLFWQNGLNWEFKKLVCVIIPIKIWYVLGYFINKHNLINGKRLLELRLIE